MPSKRLMLLCVGILVSSFFFFGCGGSSPAITISIAGTGGLTVVDGTDTLTLTATVSNDSNGQGVTWSLSGVGSLSGQTSTSVVYTAPAIPGTAQTVTVTATSIADTSKTATFTITVPAQLTITTTNSTACLTGAVGTAFSCQLSATEGEGTLKWTVDSSTPLPTGWTLSTSGLLTGPPPMSGYTGGTYKFDLTDSGTPTPMTTSVTLTITIAGAGPIVFSTTTVPPATGTYNTPYTGTVLATGGAGPLTYSLFSGALPTGLNAITSGGLISGTPTAAGTFNFTIKAADAFGDSNTQAYQVIISKATPVLNFASIPTHTFGDADFTVSASSASPGAVSYALTVGQTSSGTVSTAGLVHITGAGTIYLTATQLATTNYTGATQNVSITVNQATATVHVTPYSVTYDGNAHTATATATGVGGVALNASDFTLTGTTHTNAGTYGSDPWSFADANYVSQSGTVSDSIAKATANVTVTPYNVPYDGNPHTATATATGVGGASLSASDFTLSGTTHTNAGTYGSDPWSFADPNYVSQSGTVSDAITKATANVTVTPYNVPYDGNPHTATASATGAGGVTLSASDFTLSGTTHTNAGTYGSDPWSFADPNYVSQSGTVSDAITKATANITVTPYNVTYDGNPHTATASATGAGGVTLSASDFTLGGTTHTNAGTYGSDAWSFSDPSGNYSNASGTVSDTILKATATINVSGYTVTYDGNPHTATGTATGVGGANLNADLTLSGTTHTNAGTYASDPWSFSDPSGNYSNANGTVSDTINPEVPTLTFNSISAHYVGDANFQVTATDSSGPVSAGAITYSLTPGQASAGTVTSGGIVTVGSSAGTIYLTATQAASGNYAQTTTTTTITVYGAVTVTTTSPLPNGVVGNAYSDQLQASGGAGGPYSWTLVSGSGDLSAVELSMSTGSGGGLVSGTPTNSGGPEGFVVTATDNNGHVSAQTTLQVTIYATLSITTTMLSPSYAYTGTPYSATISALGGTGPYTWSISAGGSGLTADNLSLSSGTGLSNTISGTVQAGDPVGPVTFTVKVVDHNNVVATQQYTLQVYGALSLTTPSSTVPGPAVEGQTYTGSNINATGGSGSYAWTVTGLSGTSLTYNSTGNPLVISGTAPSTSETLHPEVTVEDTATSQTYGPIQYTIVVGPATPLTLPAANPSSLPGGTINQYYNGSINASGGSGSGYVWKINGTPVPTDGVTPLTLTDGLAAYNTGGSTLTIQGTTGGTAQTVTLTNVTVTDSANDTPTPAEVTYTIAITNPAAGYNVTGTVDYSGSLTGWIYLQLVPNSGCGSCGNLGTAIPAKGSYTIHGVPPGTYTLQAWMDNTSTDPTSHEVMGGYGGRNASNPTGVSGANVVVTNGPVNGANVTLSSPGSVSLGSNTPTWDPSNGFGVFSGGAVVSYDPITDNNGIEIPNSYIVQWNTSSAFTGTGGSQCFPATSDQNPWIISGISGTGPYYFRAAGVIGSCASGTVGNYSAATSSAYTIANPSSGNLIQGTVSFSQTATGPLYVGFYNTNTGAVYVDAIGSKASPPSSGVSYQVYVPSGSSYFNFGIVDQKNDGLLVPGDISNTNNQQMQEVSISSAEPNFGNLALPSGNGLATAKAEASQYTDISGNTGTSYNLDLRVVGLYKQPASVELVSGPSYLNPPLFDIATGEFSGNYDEWDAYPGTNGSTPSTSDVFTFNVTYTDGTSNSTLNSTPNPLTASPTAILNAFPTLTYPVWNSTGVSTTPTFTWTYPSNASNYTYQFQLEDSNYNTIWQIPSQHSQSNGFSSSISPSITWGVDPTGGGNTPNVSSLNGNTQYYWSIQATDAAGNEATTQMAFQTAQSPLTLPSSATGNALQNAPFSESLNASGGTGSGYVFSIAVGAGSYNTVPNSPSTLSLTDGISVSSNGSALTFSGTPTTVENITLHVKVTDSGSDNAGPTTYYIDVVSAPSGVNNGNLKGTYACLVTGYFDADGARWATLTNIVANGSGTLSSGVFNSNSRDYPTVSTGGVYGTLSGTYAIGSDNNGVASITGTITSSGGGTFTHTWAIALNNSNVSGTVAGQFRMIETDDLGASPSGQHGIGNCFLTNTGAYANSTLSGKSFAFGVQGENGGGAPKAYVGQFTASTGSPGGTLTQGYMDGMHLGQTGDQGGAMSSTYSSYTAPDSNGRYTLSIAPSGATDTSSNQTYIVYIIDTGKMFMLETAGDGGPMAGNVRTESQSSNTAATLLTGSAVMYNQGWEWSGSNVSGYDSSVFQGSSSSTGTYTGTFTVNASYDNSNGTYQAGKENGYSVNITLDSSNPGRATFSPGSDTVYLYFFNPVNAFFLDISNSNDYLATGWMNSQSGTFTNAALAGTYMYGVPSPLVATDNDTVGEATVSSTGNITGTQSQAGAGTFSWDQSIGTLPYSWDSTTYGTYLVGSGSNEASCIVVSTTANSSKSVCMQNVSSDADLMIFQE